MFVNTLFDTPLYQIKKLDQKFGEYREMLGKHIYNSIKSVVTCSRHPLFSLYSVLLGERCVDETWSSAKCYRRFSVRIQDSSKNTSLQKR